MLERSARVRLIALISAGFLLAGMAEAWSQQPSPGSTEIGDPQQTQARPGKEAPGTDQEDAEPPSPTIEVIPPDNVEAETQGNSAGRNKEASDYRWSDEPIVVVTAIIAAIALLQLFVFGLQARRLRQTVEAMQSTERRQLRAYVGVDDLAFEWPSERNPDYTPLDTETPGLIHKDFIKVTVKNFGLTPASDVTVYAYFASTPAFSRLPENFFRENDVDFVSQAAVRPTLARFTLHQGQTAISKSPLTDIRPLIRGRINLASTYVYGRVYYRDIYGRPWRRKFCFGWEPEHPGGERFVPYETYNDEDQKELL